MSKRILILGAGIMQGPAIRLAKARSWTSIAVDGDENAPCALEADLFRKIDLKDKDSIEAFARELAADGGIDGVMTAGTDFSATVAWVAEKLGLPGIPYETALDASNKARMRARFRSEGVPSPDFIVLSTIPDPDFMASGKLPFAFPVVVKPVDNMGSRGCRRVDTAEGLAPAVEDALRFSRSGNAIVEEYMEGPEFSVDALVSNGEITICGLADRHIFYPPYFIEMGHTIPSKLEACQARALLEVFENGVRALGIRNGAAKGDVKLTPRGPMIGEIAARLSGGYMSGWTYPYASGVEPTAGALSIAVGDKPSNLAPLRSWTCAERAFISIPGQVASLIGLDTARAVPYVRDLFLRIDEGSQVRFPENNVTKCGNILAAAPTREEAVEAAETAARAILIRLAPGNSETDSFLVRGPQGAGAFPPDAFPCDAALLAALDAMPSGGIPLNFRLPAKPATHPGAKLSSTPKIPDKEADPCLDYLAFPLFGTAPVRDYAGRSVSESLEALGWMLGVKFNPVTAASPDTLAATFWKAMIRGSYQGAAYHIADLVDKKNKNAVQGGIA